MILCSCYILYFKKLQHRFGDKKEFQILMNHFTELFVNLGIINNIIHWFQYSW